MTQLFFAAGLSIVFAAPSAFGQAIPNSPRPPEITAAGRGEVAVTPDRAAVLVSVESRAASAAMAASANASKMAAVFQALRAAGVAIEVVAALFAIDSPALRERLEAERLRVTVGQWLPASLLAEVGVENP